MSEPATCSPEFPERKSRFTWNWLRLGYVCIGALLVFRLNYIASGVIDLSKDEAYQWLWSKHLALSYSGCSLAWRWLSGKEVRDASIRPPPGAAPVLLHEFDSVADLGTREIRLGERVLRRVRLFACRNLR